MRTSISNVKTYRRFVSGLVLLIVCPLSQLCPAGEIPPYPDVEWETYQPLDISMTEVVQVYPLPSVSNRTNLHYAGTGNPEITSFRLDSWYDATDWDRKEKYKLCYYSDTDTYEWLFDGYTYGNAGIGESRCDWVVKPGAAGDIGDNNPYVLFTPSSGVYSGIKVACDVYEDTYYSYWDGNYDPNVIRYWEGSLTTFKVGVQLDPGPHKYYEDSAQPSVSYTLVDTFAGLACEADSYAYLPDNVDTPGTGTFDGEGDVPEKTMTWTVLAETNSGSVGGTMGSISHGADITVAGGHWWATARGAGIPDLGSFGTLVLTVIGKANPYVGAIATCVAGQLGTKTHFKWAFVAKSVLENVGDRAISEDEIDWFCGAYVYEDIPWLSTLSLSGSATRNLVQPTTHGSLAVDSVVQVLDDSDWNCAKVDISYVSLDPGSATFGATKPSYSSPYTGP